MAGKRTRTCRSIPTCAGQPQRWLGVIDPRGETAGQMSIPTCAGQPRGGCIACIGEVYPHVCGAAPKSAEDR